MTGSGGVGKTVLARALWTPAPIWIANGLGRPCLGHGSVSGIRDDGGRARLRLAGGNPVAALIAAVHQRKLLLVLDNAEHLVDAVATLTAKALAAFRTCGSW